VSTVPGEKTPTSARLPGLPAAREELPAALRRLIGPELHARWIAAAGAAPEARLLAAGPLGDPSGAALLLRRPGTAQVTVAGVVGDLRAVTEAVLEHARGRGAAAVKWDAEETPPDGLGFAPLRPPGDGTGAPRRGFVHWVGGIEVLDEPEHRRQSEPFTCGAVVALLARARFEGSTGADRVAELSLWRDATHVTACEPIGLALAMRRRWPELELRVHLDTDEPVMLEHLDGTERAWRAVLQQGFRREAARSGLAVDPAPLPIAGIRDGIERGEQFLLLVSLQEMLGVDVPHWLLCHGAAPGALLVEDPWVASGAGESWVDSHLLPLAEDALERMSRLGPQLYRGAIRVGASQRPTVSSQASAISR
jgi:hypothetical protein